MKFTRAHRLEIRDFLIANDIYRVACEYNGYGDSGDFSEPDFYRLDREGQINEPLPETDPVYNLPTTIPKTGPNVWNGNRYVDGKVVGVYTLGQALYDLFYEMLESAHGSWNVNEGSDGKFEWFPGSPIAWTHSENFTHQEITNVEVPV